MLRHIATTAAALSWAGLAATILLRRRPPQAREIKQNQSWKLGLALQFASTAVLIALPRRASGGPGDSAACVAGMALAPAGAAVIAASERVLGKQFAYQARLVEGHQLITAGPFGYVRHPMYLAAFGMIAAIGLARSRWTAAPPFLALYWAGTAIRVRSEEALLREAFGREFDEYAQRVPAVVPGLW